VPGLAAEEPDPRAKGRYAIVATWKEHPGYGPSQVRNTLRRKNGLKASVTTVREVMEENGYVAPKRKRKEQRGRYEAGRPRELYHLDFCHFYVHKQKQCLLFIQDDFSRFIVGWTLVAAEAADPVIACFEGAVERYGKPEAVMSDRGSAFHSWRGISRFQKLLEEYEVNFVLATDPQTNGKIEALNAAVQKECLTQVELTDLTDAARVIGRWVDQYNHQRTHHGLGGLLVPADRFYGLAERTLKMIELGQGGHALDILSPDHRGLEIFRVVSHGGSPTVYLMGKKILG
jgi:transposase InsO family protein